MNKTSCRLDLVNFTDLLAVLFDVYRSGYSWSGHHEARRRCCPERLLAIAAPLANSDPGRCDRFNAARSGTKREGQLRRLNMGAQRRFT
jgi:hypothetical protein